MAAATDYTNVAQQLYISYFGRPADYYGLQNYTAQLAALNAPTNIDDLTAAVNAEPNGALAKLVGSFNSSQESIDLYGSGTSIIEISKFVNAVYNNLFHRDADPDASFWINAIVSGNLSKANAALAITQGALANTTTLGQQDAKVIANTLAVANDFTSSLDSIVKINAYSGDNATAVGRDLLSDVTATTTVDGYHANVTGAIDGLTAPATVVVNMTEGVDTIIGTGANNVINGTEKTFNGLDSIDGGAGSDTLNLADVAGDTLNTAAVTVKNVETLVLSSTKGLGGAASDVSGWTGLTSATFNLNNIGSADQTITTAGTTATTVNATGAIDSDALTVNGGSTVTVNLKNGSNNNAGATDGIVVNGAKGATTSVTVTQTTTGTGTSAAVEINDANSGSGKANSITTVSLGGLVDSNAAINSDALTSLTVKDSEASVVVNAAVGSRVLGLTLSGNDGVSVQDSTATTLNVVASGDESDDVVLSANSATKVTVAAAVDLSIDTLTANKSTTLTVSGAGKVAVDTLDQTALTSIDASGSAGGVTIGSTLNTGVTFTGGAGSDSIVVGANTVAIATGAGDDTVTITAGVGTGGSVDGGAGNDTLAASNTVFAGLSAAQAAKYTNFETLKITNALTANVDVSKIVGLVNFVAGAGVAAGSTVSVSGLGANANVAIQGAYTGAGSIPGSLEQNSINFTGSSTTTAGDTITFDGIVISLAAGLDAVGVAAAVATAAAASTNWTVSYTTGSTNVGFTAKTVGDKPNLSSSSFVLTDGDASSTLVTAVAAHSDGTAVTAPTPGGTLNLVQATDTANDVINLKLNVNYTENNDSTSTITTLTHVVNASLVETLKVTSTGNGSVAFDGATDTKADGVKNVLNLTDDALVTLTVTGDQAFSFTSAASQTKLATLDASALTAAVTLDATAATSALTIKGSATAANVLTGGAANDTIVGGAKADTIHGGAGGDTITLGGGNDLVTYSAGDSSIGTGKFDTITDFKANTYGNGVDSLSVANGTAGTGAGATAKWTGDVLQFFKAGTVTQNAVIVDVFTSAADASTFLANHATDATHSVVAALDSTNNNLYVDNTGDGVADFFIHLTGVTTINAAAFSIVTPVV